MSNEDVILRLFAHETSHDPLEVELDVDYIIKYCDALQIEDPEDLISGMVINKSVVRYFALVPEENRGFECIRLLEKGLTELRELYSKEPIAKSGINLENELISFESQIEKSKLSVERQKEYKRILLELLKCYYSECWNAAIGLCGKMLELCMLQIHEQNKIDTSSLVFKDGSTKKIGHLTLGQLFNNLKNIGYASFILNTDQINTILYYRNGAAHYDGKTPIPARDEANAIISLTLGAIKRIIE